MDTDKKLYVLTVQSNRESKAKEHLTQLINGSSLKDRFGEITLPKNSITVTRQGKIVQKKINKFPGYLFIEFDGSTEAIEFIEKAPLVKRFLRYGTKEPMPLSDDESQKLIQKDHQVQSIAAIYPGQEVTIIEGPFMDFSGVVDSINDKKQTAIVSLFILGRSTQIEVNLSQLIKD